MLTDARRWKDINLTALAPIISAAVKVKTPAVVFSEVEHNFIISGKNKKQVEIATRELMDALGASFNINFLPGSNLKPVEIIQFGDKVLSQNLEKPSQKGLDQLKCYLNFLYGSNEKTIAQWRQMGLDIEFHRGTLASKIKKRLVRAKLSIQKMTRNKPPQTKFYLPKNVHEDLIAIIETILDSVPMYSFHDQHPKKKEEDDEEFDEQQDIRERDIEENKEEAKEELKEELPFEEDVRREIKFDEDLIEDPPSEGKLSVPEAYLEGLEDDESSRDEPSQTIVQEVEPNSLPTEESKTGDPKAQSNVDEPLRMTGGYRYFGYLSEDETEQDKHPPPDESAKRAPRNF